MHKFIPNYKVLINFKLKFILQDANVWPFEKYDA